MTDHLAALPEPAVVEQGPSPWWARFLACWPWPMLYALASFLAWLAFHVRHRRAVIRQSLEIAFPGRSFAERERIRRGYYRGFADVMIEIAKTPRMSANDIRSRVHIRNLDAVSGPLRLGRPVLVVAAHQCN
ncbi:MAG: lysophospholipid acyltransferase family protein, partial [Steroidobacterales bacterium]